MGRPSPRTQGVEVDPTTGDITTFQKYGTQQLKFVDDKPPELGTPYQGVTQIDTGKAFKALTTSVIPYPRTGIQSVFSERFQSGITGATPTALRETALARNKEIFAEMGLPDLKLPDLGDLFGAIDKHGCECEACKNGTGQCSDKNPKCNAWDLGCEAGGAITNTITNPITSWFDKFGIWVYIILGVIGIGIFLWLLRPLFSMIGAFKGGAV